MGFWTDRSADSGTGIGTWLWVLIAALAILGVLAAAGRAPGVMPEPPAMEVTHVAHGREILGTRGPDVLRGTDEDDLIFAFGGDDRIYAGSGDDLIDAGNGSDTIHAGPGDDRIRAYDGARDTIFCGPGDDIVFADPFDDVADDCEEIVRAEDIAPPATPAAPDWSTAPPQGGAAPLVTDSVSLEDEPWRCGGPVDVELVRVRISAKLQGVDAISIGAHCTGRIGRIEVDTWSGDGLKVQNSGVVAHDLVIESGVVRCHDRTPGHHQDGIQVMGGARLTFRSVAVHCGGEGVNAALFIARGGTGDETPVDVVFEHGFLGVGAGQTVFVADSRRSGVRQSVICSGRFATTRVLDAAIDSLLDENQLLDASDRRCRRT